MLKTILLCLVIIFSFCCNDNDIDCDTDGDGCIDLLDDFPNDESYYRDSDADGIPDETDLDIDGDGYVDNIYAIAELFPDSSENYWQSLVNDLDRTKQMPSCIDDSDGDGCNDLFDHYPNDPDQDTDASLYNKEKDVPNCEERMKDCEGLYLLLP